MREIRVASLACNETGGIESSLERAAAMVEEACLDPMDLLCFPEIFPWSQLGKEKIGLAEPLDGRVGSVMAGLAARHGVHILTPMLERSGNRVYNTMAWFDRRGNLLGVYRKTYPTDYEMADGISPGPADFDVFHTEFGPIGCCICFDLNFRDVIERIAAQQAKLVIFPAMFRGVFLMQAWAKLYRMYFLSVIDDPSAALVDALGRVSIEPWGHGPILSATLNLDYAVLHCDYNAKKFPAIKAAYGPLVEIEYLQIESAAMLSSRHPTLSALQIAQEFNLELEEDYYRRCAALRVSNLP